MGPAYHALAAAMCNSTIGVFSRWGFAADLDHASLAFYRAATGLVVLSVILVVSGRVANVIALRSHAVRLAVAAFFGVFVLYTFEVWALSLAPVSTVSFLLYASGVFAVVVGAVWLKERLSWHKGISVAVVILGIGLMFLGPSHAGGGFEGAVLAVIAGSGYSMFLVLMKRFDIPGGLASLWWLFAFGTLYLAIPAVARGLHPPTSGQLPAILALAVVPTIGGFYFTTKALEKMDAGRVQIYEMSEPAFAALLALAVLGERMTVAGFVGAALILLGLVVLQIGDGILAPPATETPEGPIGGIVPLPRPLPEED